MNKVLNVVARGVGLVIVVIAYIRSLKPVENTPPEVQLNVPLNLIVRTIPLKRSIQPEPDTSNI